MQDFAVLLVGLALGPVAGFAALALYLAEGAMGMPVFTPQGLGGIAQIIGPTGGFLLSFPFVAAIAGWGARSLRIKNGFARTAVACTFASIVLFAFGATWLAQYRHLSPLPVFHMAVTPFLPGNAVKIGAAAGIFSAIDRLRRA
jgi:biotin transport system substrate-specific component